MTPADADTAVAIVPHLGYRLLRNLIGISVGLGIGAGIVLFSFPGWNSGPYWWIVLPLFLLVHMLRILLWPRNRMLVIDEQHVWIVPREETARAIAELDPGRRRSAWVEALIWQRQYRDVDGSILFEIPRADFSSRQIKRFERALRQRRARMDADDEGHSRAGAGG